MRPEAALAERDELIDITPARAAEMRRLFAEVFGHAMSPEHWHWKYADGRGQAVGLWRGDRLWAHYGGVTRAMVQQGRAVRACQICDVMVAPGANRALVRKGPLYQVTARFLSQQVGHGRPHEVAYGFPSQRAHDVAQRLGLYGQVDTTIGLAWPALAPAPAPRRARLAALADHRPAAPSEQRLALRGDGRLEQAAAVDALWARMAAGLHESLIGVRDAAWLAHRYLRHPTWQYEVWLLRQGLLRKPLGVMVLRPRDTHLDLIDLVGPPSAFAALVLAARRRAHALGLARVEAWITESHRALLAAEDDPIAQATGMRLPLPHNLHAPGPSEAQMRGRWLLLAGDADFT